MLGSSGKAIGIDPIWSNDESTRKDSKIQIIGKLLEEVDYVPGRVVLFPGHYPHRGLGANKEYSDVYRYSIPFRVRPMPTAFR